MENKYKIPILPLNIDLETKEILIQLNEANKNLAELKGMARTIPNEAILINSLTLQEAKDSSEVENIVTTHDDLYKADLDFKHYISSAATKEVLNYREAIQFGFFQIRKNKLLTNKVIKEVQQILERNDAGFRSVPGTTLKDSNGKIIYTPPQSSSEVKKYMDNLENFINDNKLQKIDPLIKLAIIHHQFESIHPFYDGNGRTGRIISVLYLVSNDLLELPILYLSRYITHNKREYYRLLQTIREKEDNGKEWQEWVLFILKGIEITAKDTILMIKGISELMNKYKEILRPLFGKQYKHELLNNLFFHPYTKIEYLERDMLVQRKTATKYLNKIVDAGLLEKVKISRTNYYINSQLVSLFLKTNYSNDEEIETIESIS
ncbi:MAG: Fic family protein [Bacteroidetes bacterium]|nr:Fic family protein [Bacteroidota bacterium]